jgi:hypothetical protein
MREAEKSTAEGAEHAEGRKELPNLGVLGALGG